MEDYHLNQHEIRKTMNKFSEQILLPEQNHEIYLFDPFFVFFCGLISSHISMAEKRKELIQSNPLFGYRIIQRT